jgi:hypothetical protein
MGSTHVNVYPDYNTIFGSPIDASADSISSQDFDTLKARTNPSRPVVTPLTLIQDLVDIPRQLKDVGRLLKKGTKGLNLKEISNQNLGIQFGWLPLIDDAKNLLDLQLHIAKRSMEIDRLYQKSGLKRRIQLSENSIEATQTNLTLVGDSASGSVFADAIRHQVTTKWGTVRWVPTALPPGVTESDIRSIRSVRRIVSGLTPDGLLKGAWDVIPWTWLTDWFVDVGSYMGAHSNFVPATASHCCVMRKTETATYIKPLPSTSAWVSFEPCSCYVTTKERNVVSAPFAVSIPFVGIRRLSILSSLFVQRFK